MVNFLTMIETEKGWKFVAPAVASDGGKAEFVTLDSTDPDLLADQAIRLVDSKRGKVFLAIRSDQAMAANLSIESGKVRCDHETLTFLLEEQLPLGAEQVVADFMTADDHALGIAVETQRYRPLVLALEQAGLHVQGIAPAATILLQGMCKSFSDEDDFVLFADADGMELFQIKDRVPTNWWFHSSKLSSTPFHTELLTATTLAQRPLQLRTFVDTDFHIPGLTLAKVDSTNSDQTTFESRICAGLQPIADGSTKLWFDLHRGQLAIGDPLRDLRSPMRMLAIASLCLMFAIGAAGFLRANRMEVQMQQLQQTQRSLFAKALPDQNVSHGGILSRLKSHVKSMRGARDRTQNIQLAPSAVLVMQRLLTALQDVDEFEVRQAAIENGQIDVDLAVTSFADVNAIISSLQQHGFRMSPPSSNQQGDLVLSRLLGDAPNDLYEQPASAVSDEYGQPATDSNVRPPEPLRESTQSSSEARR